MRSVVLSMDAVAVLVRLSSDSRSAGISASILFTRSREPFASSVSFLPSAVKSCGRPLYSSNTSAMSSRSLSREFVASSRSDIFSVTLLSCLVMDCISEVTAEEPFLMPVMSAASA